MFILKHGIELDFKQLNITVDSMVAVALARAIYLQDDKYYCFSFVHDTRLWVNVFSYKIYMLVKYRILSTHYILHSLGLCLVAEELAIKKALLKVAAEMLVYFLLTKNKISYAWIFVWDFFIMLLKLHLTRNAVYHG